MSERGLEWTSETHGGVHVVSPVGKVDESTATEFSERLVEAVAAAGGRLVVDLAGVAYMSSRGLRALTLGQRRASETGTTIALARPNEVMREILAISRYDMVFRVTDSIEDALTG